MGKVEKLLEAERHWLHVIEDEQRHWFDWNIVHRNNKMKKVLMKIEE